MTAELKKLKDFPQDKLSEMEKIRNFDKYINE